jgi:GT2 family glycosyltransferase
MSAGALLPLVPYRDSESDCEIQGFDAYAGRWIRLRARLEIDGRAQVWPAMYFDYGSGYSELHPFPLPPCSGPGAALIDYLLRVPQGTRAARIDADARFSPREVRITRLSSTAAALRMLGPISRSDGALAAARYGLKALAGSLFERGRVARRFPLIERYRELRLGRSDSYEDWIAAFEPQPRDYGALCAASAGWRARPKISVLMPVFNPPAQFLREAIESVLAQIYPEWELCVADDASSAPHVGEILRQYETNDPRVRVARRTSRGHIAAATNSALALASGDYVALLDHDDRLHPAALHFVAEAIARHPAAGIVYSDEDKLDHEGRRYEPYFKCEFNYELFLAHNMVSHLGVYRRRLVEELGGLRSGYDGSQDYDLALRAVERLRPEEIVHIPRVLYHWRASRGSTAVAAMDKPYAVDAARRAVQDHLARRGVKATVMAAPAVPTWNRVRFALPEPGPKVSIIVPTRDRADLLAVCLESIRRKTSYGNYEVIVVDNGSREPATQELLRRQPAGRVRVLRDARPFNYSALNNRAVREAAGDFVCLMNNDIEILTSEWIEEMLSFAAQPSVGAVGARLWYPDGRLQHAGVILGLGSVAEHAHRFLQKNQPGYFGRAALHQSFSAVTAACLLIRKSIYEQVGGLDEQLAVTFNDVDFCLRVRAAGYRNVWTPYAEMIHHESATRGADRTAEERKRTAAEVRLIESRWGSALARDPAYSPNLTLERDDFSLAWPPRL